MDFTIVNHSQVFVKDCLKQDGFLHCRTPGDVQRKQGRTRKNSLALRDCYLSVGLVRSTRREMQPREYLSHSAQTFRNVEVDSTFYATLTSTLTL